MEETELLLPREKMLRHGVTLLKDDELLALFLRTGTPGKTVFTLAKELIDHFGSLYGLLTAELARRFYNVRMEEEDPILTPDMTREFLQSQLSDLEREIFMVIFLDNKNRVLKHTRLFSGTLSHVEVHPREIVREAIKVNAAGVILAHNHPSGCAEPSRADKAITERIIKCCQFMDIRVLDHLIIGRGEYISFAERGWI